jgi:hypothetical protein
MLCKFASDKVIVGKQHSMYSLNELANDEYFKMEGVHSDRRGKLAA